MKLHPYFNCFKRYALYFAVVLLCLAPLTALGYSVNDEATFGKFCRWRMTKDATLYDRQKICDENGMEIGWEFVPIGTIAAGKRISSLAEIDGKYDIFYWNGGRKTAYVDPGTFSRHTKLVTSTSGQTYDVSVTAWGDEAAVREIVGEFYTPAEVDQFIEGMRREMKGMDPITGQPKKEGSSSSSAGSSSGKKKPKTTPVPLDKPEIVWKQGEEDIPVDVKTAGVTECVIVLKEKEERVGTAHLFWGYEGEKPLARVYAPRTGKATLYAREGGKGGALKKLDAGEVVLVLEDGEKYTKVYVRQLTGYVLTDALAFENVRTEWEKGSVKSTVNFRLMNEKDSYRMGSLKKRQEVYVLSQSGQWTEIEADGRKGYAMSEFLE